MNGRRIAYAGDLGVIPLDPEVDGLIRAALARLTSIGALVEDACFDTSDIKEIVSGTRAFGMVARYADRFDAHQDLMTQQLINQITPSLGMSLREVTQAERLRTAYWHRARRFMKDYEFIVAPCVGAPPFRLDEPLPSKVGGKPVERFQDVFLSTYVFSVTGLPMAAVPCGLTGDGRPVGMQIIGRRLRDDSVLEAAAAYQSVAGELFRRPEIDLDAVKPVSEAMQTPGVSIDRK